MYNQDEVNDNLEKLFDVPKTARTVGETRNNIVRTDSSTKVLVHDDDNPELLPTATEKESKKSKRVYNKKSPSRGGARPGSGRPKGSTNKITLDSLVHSIDNTIGMSFEQRLALNYKDAIDRQDWLTVKDYDKAFLSKIVADKQEVDVTSNGETMGVQLIFTPVELPEWNKQ